MSHKKDIDPHFKSKLADKLSVELTKLMTICRKNLQHAQKLQKQACNKNLNPKSYAFSNKIWLNSKYIKTKSNRKLEGRFLGLFQVLYLLEKQAFKLKLQKRWKIHDIFYILLFEQDNIKKIQVDKKVSKWDTSNKVYKEDKMEAG